MWGPLKQEKPPRLRRLMLSICYRNVVPKVRVELTRGHPQRFLSLVRVVLIDAIRRDLVQPPEYLPASVRA